MHAHKHAVDRGTSVSASTKSNESIRSILLQRGFTLQGHPVPHFSHQTSGVILRYLSSYNRCRIQLSHGSDDKGPPRLTEQALVRELESQRLLVQAGRGVAFPADLSAEGKRFLNGTWLEEYVWHVMQKSGADEVMMSQKIFWHVDGVDGHNELDVIARHASSLTFISCKTRSPMDTKGATEDVSKQVYEVAYWKQHFMRPGDKAILATTLDMVDENDDDRERAPMIRARASVLGIEVWGYEDLSAMNKVVDVR